MRIRSFTVQNVFSYGDLETLHTEQAVSLIIGPNGGGKTNLFDALTTVIRKFIIANRTIAGSMPENGRPMRELQENGDVRNLQLDKHNLRLDEEQIATLEIEVTESDVESMAIIYGSRDSMTKLSSNIRGWGYKFCEDWGEQLPSPGHIVTVKLKDGDLQFDQADEASNKYIRFLKNYEIDRILREESGEPNIAFPFLYLPTNRAHSGVTSSVDLPNFDLHQQKKVTEGANSRNANSQIVHLAVGRLARLYRSKVDTKGGSESVFNALPEVVAITKELNNLGYSWSIRCTDIQKNTYSIEISKRGKVFRLDQASSGERELLSYVIGILGLGIKDALILVDEPELHLHPEWQGLLLEMFGRLAGETGNQFVLATHSPRMVTPASIGGVSRVYSDGESSHIQRLDAVSLPTRKHLFSIVNSQNNERIFFADAVLLVEGQSDRIFVESALKELDLTYVDGIMEVIGVGGKTLFSVYQQLLDALQIKNFVIADRDYLKQIGTAEVKGLFRTDLSKIRTDVVFNEKSYDGDALIREIDNSISSGRWSASKELWDHIKSTRLGALENLTNEQSSALDKCIADHASNGQFVLREGSLEDYLPEGYKGKDIEKLIQLTSETGFWSKLPRAPREEFEKILKSICVIGRETTASSDYGSDASTSSAPSPQSAESARASR